MPSTETQPAGVPNEDGEMLYVDTRMEEGHPVSVIRDPQGHIVYPTYVPPGPQSPTGKSQASVSSENPPQASKGLRKHASDPTKLEKQEKRPGLALDKKFVTEMHRGSRSQSSYTPQLRRAGTNVSELQQAIWQPYDGDDDDEETSSSSSSDDDEVEEQAASQQDGASQRKPMPMPRPSDQFRRFKVGNESYRTKGKVSKKDGRLSISVKDTSHTGYLAKALGAAVRKVVPISKEGAEGQEVDGDTRPSKPRQSSATSDALKNIPCPKLNIVIMVIGSRGDAQPFLKVGKVLKEQYGHRVRIATHPAFREFVEKDSGLEFFSVGGDPSELMAFMVKNPGMIPTLETVKAGDIGRRRAAMAEMFEGFWRACVNATDDAKDTHNIKMMGAKEPFVADAIIANPPSFAHLHCAEALGIPLHLMFTFPYTPTQAFPHPLASVKKSNVDPGYTNFISYPLVEMMVWQGLGDLVNDFRVKTLGLDPVSTLWAPGATYRLHVPFTYMWSPGLVPKPEDWGPEVDVSGFVFLDLASSFKPPSDLEKFLAAGEAPIYIGFGSIVVDDADRFTDMIFEAVKLAGVRALVSKGWGGLGGEDDSPDNIYMLENTPHDWLFPKVRACVIHGGAGTTAIAMKCGKPTMVVPFFGDQHFWGGMLERSKAGPEPVPYKHLTAKKLAEGIKYCLTDEARQAAEEIAKDVELEGDGAENACKSFHQNLRLHGKHSMRCSLLEDRVAVWKMKNSSLKLSAVAADALVEKGYISWRKLRLVRHNEWNDFEGPGEPVTGLAGSLVSSFSNVVGGIGGVPYRLAKSSAARRERKEKKRERRAARARAKQQKAAAHKTPEGPESKTNGADASARLRKKSTPDIKDFAKEDRKPPSQDPTDDADDHAETASIETAGTDGTAETTEDNAAEQFATDVSKGVGKTVRGIARAPVDLSLAVAQGFHNAPRLYGDDTVRRPPRVTGIHSGLRAARHEFAYGIYDGFTGLVRLPVRGARDGGGVRGFAKGVGMGVTGFVLKDIAALAGPVGYTLKGVAKQIERGRFPAKMIRRARILQGQRETRALQPDEVRKATVAEALHGWDTVRALGEAVGEQERRKGGLRQHLPGHQRGAWHELGPALESAAVAERALAAVKRGESMESVVGTKKERASQAASSAVTRGRRSTEEQRRSSVEKPQRKSMERERGGGEEGKAGGRKRAGTTILEENEDGGEGGSGGSAAATDVPAPVPPATEGKEERAERAKKLSMNGTV